ncbi:MAG: hypothetical protein ACRD0K_20770 [Egibacteraceae bacterium]
MSQVLYRLRYPAIFQQKRPDLVRGVLRVLGGCLGAVDARREGGDVGAEPRGVCGGLLALGGGGARRGCGGGLGGLD